MIKIPFYETSNFVFSNFSPHSIRVNGVLYPTVEHAYHAAKFDDKNIKEEIRNTGSPLEALQLSKKYLSVKKQNWDEVKVNILYELIKEKAQQNEEVRDALIATGDEEIVEDNPHNDFWGNGKDGNGQNQMGKILMKIRGELISL
jgi:N-glycosidase YbiA